MHALSATIRRNTPTSPIAHHVRGELDQGVGERRGQDQHEEGARVAAEYLPVSPGGATLRYSDPARAPARATCGLPWPASWTAGSTSSAPRSRPSSASSPPTSACPWRSAWPTAPMRSRSRCARSASAPATTWSCPLLLLCHRRGRAAHRRLARVLRYRSGDLLRHARHRARCAHPRHEGGHRGRTCSATSRPWRRSRRSACPSSRTRAGRRLRRATAAAGRARHDRHLVLLPVEEPRRLRRRRRGRHADATLADAVRTLRFHGSADKSHLTPRWATTRASTSCRPRSCGSCCRDLDGWAAHRATAGDWYLDAGIADVAVLPIHGARRSAGVARLRGPSPAGRRRDRGALRGGIGARAYYRTPIHRQPAMARGPTASRAAGDRRGGQDPPRTARERG